MELTFILSAAIFTLLAIVVATSLLNGSTSSPDFSSARRYFGSGLEQPKQNGHVPDTNKKTKQQKQKVQDDWCDLSGSSHDHWDVVKSVQSEEAQPHDHSEEQETPGEHSSSTSMSLETEGATESPDVNDKLEPDDDCLKYLPGKARSHHLEMMMSTEELEEEQRVQREQLAAIFQLLKENKETFGDVSEGDMEEQLRLYSI
ncbi:matrix-remodeling-associated protein 7 isoform X2 [Sparus aurata]|uniref:matrix-remodeling-associated protein 7 isoform X2 n=1 Tax=Sparus aurata TaxID=8175 RepID=UPI0011C1A78D|nr:matrix-remodeling-associated protein 7-like isoform X2 [Sparus aurata]